MLPRRVFVVNPSREAAPSLEDDFSQRLQQQKLLALRDFAYGASHELNNPLANIAARAQALLATETDGERRRQLRAIWQQSLRAFDMLADLMLYAKPPRRESRDCRVGDLVHDFTQWVRGEIAARGVAVEFSVRAPADPTKADSDASLRVDPIQIQVALTALAKNGLESMGPTGRLTLEWAPPDELESMWRFAIHDTGPGLSVEAFLSAVHPFRSGREAGRGLGFGLSKAWRIATDHGGALELDPARADGCRIVICLPVA